MQILLKNYIERVLQKMNELPKRKQIRLKDYDYSQNGYYFITVCTHNQQNLFGEIVGATLWDIVEWFKTMTTNEYIANVKNNKYSPFDKKYGNVIILSMLYAMKTII